MTPGQAGCFDIVWIPGEKMIHTVAESEGSDNEADLLTFSGVQQ